MGRDYLIASAHLFVVSNWARWVNFDLTPYPNVIFYPERIAQRDAVIFDIR
jgi:glutathione S-transferase